MSTPVPADKFTEKQRTVIRLLGRTDPGIAAEADGIETGHVRAHVYRINRKYDDDPIGMDDEGRRIWTAEYNPPVAIDAPNPNREPVRRGDGDETDTVARDDGKWRADGSTPTTDEDDEDDPALHHALDFASIEVRPDAEPSKEDLSDREEYIVRKLGPGTTIETLADDIGARPEIIAQHLRSLRREGWHIYVDESAELVTIEGDHVLRSSEHTGTRTRKANRWWEQRHNELQRGFNSLDTPTADLSAAEGNEDWVTHMTDIHAGDRVRTPAGHNVYNGNTIPSIVRYITEKSLGLAEKHGSTYDTAHLLWGGDFITNEGIYSGQFEDLDAWLDEQHDMLADPLTEQLKAFSDRFDTVNVVVVVGNHGENRASGTSRQANADLILYKSIRNMLAAVRKYGEGDAFDNVNFNIVGARPYVNFPLRGGAINGHLRHGQDRDPQAKTRKGSDEWGTTLRAHEFDIAWIGHHHISGRIPWDGPPVYVSGSPKPPSTFVERIAASSHLDPDARPREIATCHGVADHGHTGAYPIKTHDFDYVEASRQVA